MATSVAKPVKERDLVFVDNGFTDIFKTKQGETKMFKLLEGWSFKTFGAKWIKRAISPLSGILVAWLTKIAPDTVSAQGAENVQIVAGFVVAILVEMAINLITYASKKKDK